MSLKTLNRLMILALTMSLTFVSLIQGGVPTAMNYQGLLTDDGGEPVPDGDYAVTFTIYDANVGGNSKWIEPQTVSTSDGLFSVILGSINPIDFTVFNGAIRYLGIKVGSDPELTPRLALVSVPFAMWSAQSDISDHALHANVADSADAVTDGAIDLADVGRNGATDAQILKWSNAASSWETADDVSGVADIVAGDGLVGGGQSETVNIDVDFSGSGSSQQVSRSDHNHDGAYVNEGQASSITSAMIQNRTITDADIASGAISNARLAEEAGISTASNTAELGVGESAFADLLTVTLSVPSSGYIFLQGSSTATLSGSTNWGYAVLQIDDTEGGTSMLYASSAGAEGFATADQKEFALSPTRVFWVSSAGTYTYRLEGRRLGYGSVTFKNSRLVAVYFKTTY